MKLSESFASLKRILQHVEHFGIKEGLKLFRHKHSTKESAEEFSFAQFRNSITLRAGTSDFNTFYHIFFEEQYNFKMDQQPKIIVDCGANIGLSALYFAQKYPDCKIIAVEPEKSNFDILKHNTRNYPNITCLNNGIWHKQCNLEIMDIGLGKWGFVTKEVPYSNENTIAAISIGDIMMSYQLSEIDLLKIDIEGSEKEVFELAEQQWLSKVKTIVVETHDYMKEGSTKALFQSINAYNYKVSISGENLVIQLK